MSPLSQQSHTNSARRYDLDWLRVLAILTVFVFHSGRFFDLGDWHVKNPATYLGVQVWTTFLAHWLMPLIFVISGASTFYALGTPALADSSRIARYACWCRWWSESSRM